MGKFDRSIVPLFIRSGKEDVVARSVKVSDISNHEPISFHGAGFNMGNAVWNTSMLTYKDFKNATRGYAIVPDCVECRSDSEFEAQQTRTAGFSAREG
jgi:hypothetical protein